MQFTTQLLACSALLAGLTTAAALPGKEARSASIPTVLTKRGNISQCQRAPGSTQCAVIVTSSVSSTGLPGTSPSSDGYVQVADTNCNNIVTSGQVGPQGIGNGFGGTLQLSTDGKPSLVFHATSIGYDATSGVTFTVGGTTYTQGANCFSYDFGGTPTELQNLQCNFPC